MERIIHLTALLTDHPDDAFIQHALALEYIKKGDDTKAKALFENILRVDENYTGTYYHLAKLLERNDQINDAVAVYKKGMMKAKEAGDQHTYNELQAAYEDLTF